MVKGTVKIRYRPGTAYGFPSVSITTLYNSAKLPEGVWDNAPPLADIEEVI
jgi:hypothetical protein